ncbi:MAG: ATP phosphoribosyltransferase regulatory subunit, partial [Lachnospiraceae bacterium]|nr:ATP phosphoribosyltransferase regulatory subunit [Lachnospiraceae bacterium]
MKDLLHTPEGVRDIYNGEYRQKLEIESAIHEVFTSSGYMDIQTPTFEYFNLFDSDIGTTPGKDLYRFTDRDGETVVLRSDFTPSIARCAAKYFLEEQGVLKFTYKGNTFSQTGELQGKLRETTQMGVEMIGDDSIDADVEMLKLSFDAIKAVSDKNFVISVSHIEYFKGLCEELGIAGEYELKLRDLITNKNFVAARQFLESRPSTAFCLSDDAIEKILKIEDLAGGYEILDKALALASNDRSIAAIKRLKDMHDSLKALGLDDKIAYDLSMLNKYTYYTGVV